MQNIQQEQAKSFIDQYLIYSNQDDIEDVTPPQKYIIPNGHTCKKIYKREYKNASDVRTQANKYLLYRYKNGYDPCYKHCRSGVTLKRQTNTEIYKSSEIFGFKIVKQPLFIKRIHNFYINFCALLAEHNDYKDQTRGTLNDVFKCIRFDLHYPLTFQTVSPITYRQRRKYKSHYTKRFTTKHVTYFNKLLVHFLKHSFSRYMIMYNTEFRAEHDGSINKRTANNPHHHYYVYFNSRYSLKKFFDAVNTFWCLSLKMVLPDNKKMGLVHQCPPHKSKDNNKHWEYTNGNGLVLDETKETFIPNIQSIFMRSSYLCKRVPDNKTVDLGKQFNIMTDETTQKYINDYRQYVLPVYVHK